MSFMLALGLMGQIGFGGATKQEQRQPVESVRCVCHVHATGRDWVYTTSSAAECRAMSTPPTDPFWQTCRVGG